MKYLPKMESVETHQVPKWYEDAKLGIFIHWGLFSVPAFAPPSYELGEISDDRLWLANNPYAEWYMNSLRLGHGLTYEHHKKTYGVDFPYYRFAELWKAEKWDPAAWAALFKKAGAQYVIPVTKHHDGFCLWDSAYTDFNSAKQGPARDIIAELSMSLRQESIRMGLYYSGVLDWRFTRRPILSGADMEFPENQTYTYADYAYNQVMELIDLYHPSVLWNDIGWPEKGRSDLPTIFAHYYNTVPDGVVNDRWSGVWHDFTTKEYLFGEKNLQKKWEMTRGIGLSFGYNQIEEEKHLLSSKALISLLIDTVAYNGNLLIDIGPKADGTIPGEQETRLLALGNWLETHGEGIYGTKPWIRQHEKAENGSDIYFTQKDHEIFVFLDNLPQDDSQITLAHMGEIRCIRSLDGENLTFKSKGDTLTISAHGIKREHPTVGLCLTV